MKNNYYTPSEVAVKTGYTKDCVWRWIRESKIPSEKVAGRVYLIPKNKQIEDWIAMKIKAKKEK